jgi:hypothetical protein
MHTTRIQPLQFTRRAVPVDAQCIHDKLLPVPHTCRYYNQLSALPTIRFVLSYDTTTDYPVCSPLSLESTADYPTYRLSALICMALLPPPIYCALLCLAILQPTIHSDLSRNTTNDCLLYSIVSRDIPTAYPIFRLSALICMAMLQTPLSCALLCLPILQPTTCGDLLCLVILPPTIQSTNYPLCSVWRCFKRLSAVLYCVSQYSNWLSALLYLSILQPTICSSNFPLCSVLRYYNRLSYMLYLLC